MEKVTLAALALRMMTAAQPEAPWRGTYPATADAFAEVALDAPLFAGAQGPARTVALFVSLAWFEGALKQDAQGDCLKKDDKGRCLIDKVTGANIGEPQSLCVFQVGVGHLAGLGITKDTILGDIKVCTSAARGLIATSMRICRERPELDWLGWYAHGGEGCTHALEKSAHRMHKARWLFDHYPVE